MNIKDAIKLGEDSIVEYINNHMVLDNELKSLKRYQKIADSSKVTGALDKYFKKVANTFLETKATNFNICSNETILNIFAKCEDEDYLKLVANEVSKRSSNYKITPSFLTKIIKSRDTEFSNLALLEPKTRREYMFSKDFTKLDNEKSFDNYKNFQCSGLFEVAITSGANFVNCLNLWDTKKEDIKTCFNYFDIFVVEALYMLNQDKTNNSNLNELVTNYLNHHIDSLKYGSIEADPEYRIDQSFYAAKFKRIAETLNETIGDEDLKTKLIGIKTANDMEPIGNNLKKKPKP